MDRRNQTSQDNSNDMWRPILYPSVPFVYHAMAQVEENSMTESNIGANAYRTTQSHVYFPMGNIYQQHSQGGVLPSFDPRIQPIVRPTMSDVSGYNHCGIQPSFQTRTQPTVPPSLWPIVQPLIHPNVGYAYWNNPNCIRPSYYPGFQTIAFPNTSYYAVNPQHFYPHPIVTSQQNPCAASSSNQAMDQLNSTIQPPAVPVLEEGADFEVNHRYLSEFD